MVRVYDDPYADAALAPSIGLLWVDQATGAFYPQPLSESDGQAVVSAKGPAVESPSRVTGAWGAGPPQAGRH